MFWRNAHAWEPGTLVRAGLDPTDIRSLAQRLRARELQTQPRRVRLAAAPDDLRTRRRLTPSVRRCPG